MIPETIGRYEVQCLLGEGAFGQVYAARDPVLGRAVAIKVLRDTYSADASFMERFRAEATSLAALTHHNITPIYDLLQSGSQHGMVMELVRGHTLEHILQHKPQLGLPETLAVVGQAVAGLGYVHRQDVVHRDIKPSNIMLTASGVLKIMDFGIARVQGAKRLTRDGSVLGTLAYAAPEQIKDGEGEPRSDQYSLACVVYEMLCGRLPFEATTEYELMHAHIAKVPDSGRVYVPDLPPEVDRALMRALAKNPADRFETVEAFGRALGTDAVQLQAVDMVRGLVASAAPIPEIPQRSPSSEKRGSSPVPSPSPAPAPAPVAIRRPSRIRQHSPLLVMGTAAVLALGVAGFILFDSRQPVTTDSQTAQVDARSVVPNPPAQPPPVTKRELEPAKPEAAKPEVPKQAEPQVVPPPAPPPSQSKPAEKLPIPPQIVQPKTLDKPADGELRPSIQPAPPEKLPDRPPLPRPESKPPVAEKPADKPPEPPAAEKKAEPAPMPSGPANYQGRVVAWLSPSTIMVRAATGGGFEKLTLYGIRDNPIANQKEADAVRDQLESFMSKYGRDATCFNRYSTEFKQAHSHCFVDKHDMALWAIENKLGQTTNVAPDNYPKMPR